MLSNLKEKKHFTVIVPKSDSLSACVKCNVCQTTIHLCRKDKTITASSYMISNWTRHVNMCQKLEKRPDSYQQSIIRFLSPTSTSSSAVSYPSDDSSPDGSSSSAPSSASKSLQKHDNLLHDGLPESPLTLSEPEADQIFVRAPPSALSHQ